ncbi:hypothetical protein [Marinobacter sp. KMM 10035]|uniref:hypothetical protein n=1 Tax=Marinobacter sp. KMM 10035 TaxID=3134034 RepID=UPI00397D0C15
MHSGWLAHYLVRRAEPLNQAYRLARQGDPVQFANTFSCFIRDALDPLMSELDCWSSEHKAALTETAYHCGLAMVRHGWLTSEHQAVSIPLFRELLPAWLAPYPEDAPGMLTRLLNALSHLSGSNQRAHLLAYWKTCLPTPEAAPDTLLVLGWMSGLPQFREAALEGMRRRPELTVVLGLGDPTLFQNPWWQGSQGQWYTSPVVLGASVWLGGEFSSRPQLLTDSGHTFIKAGSDCWQLHVDAFGQALLPQRQDNLEGVPALEYRAAQHRLAPNWREFDEPCQCLERPYDWVVSFHNRYAVMVIPKAGDLR